MQRYVDHGKHRGQVPGGTDMFGPPPRDLGERIKRPASDPLRSSMCTLTRLEYYRYRYDCEPPAYARQSRQVHDAA